MAKDTAHRLYDLHKARKQKDKKYPFSHQSDALTKLSNWYKANKQPSGGLLVLPTGGGKTFTAMRFLAKNPLSKGYKILWLVHKHDLIDQAFGEVSKSAGSIENREELNVRMVSGAPTHDKAGDIKPSDDVIIATLQTMNNAWKKENPKFMEWLDSTDGKLFIVHDEAHHAPAPTFRKLLLDLREDLGNFRLLGLTATPTYTDETKRGWLSKVFPQGIISQVTAQQLIADGTLSKPLPKDIPTRFEVEVDDSEVDQWQAQFGDVPARIIKKLAESKQRNKFIANTYADSKEKYGKTIMFVDRWFQCEQIEGMLEKLGLYILKLMVMPEQ